MKDRARTGRGDRRNLRLAGKQLEFAEPETRTKDMGKVRALLMDGDLKGKTAEDDAAQPIGGVSHPIRAFKAIDRYDLASTQKLIGERRRRGSQPAVLLQVTSRLFDDPNIHVKSLDFVRSRQSFRRYRPKLFDVYLLAVRPRQRFRRAGRRHRQATALSGFSA